MFISNRAEQISTHPWCLKFYITISIENQKSKYNWHIDAKNWNLQQI